MLLQFCLSLGALIKRPFYTFDIYYRYNFIHFIYTYKIFIDTYTCYVAFFIFIFLPPRYNPVPFIKFRRETLFPSRSVESQERSMAHSRFAFYRRLRARVFRVRDIRDSGAFTISINCCRADDY